jgi:hypothetical protein
MDRAAPSLLIRRTCDGVILAALPDDLSARGDGTEELTDPPTRP